MNRRGLDFPRFAAAAGELSSVSVRTATPRACFQAPRLCRPARTPYDTLNLPNGAGVEWRKDH